MACVAIGAARRGAAHPGRVLPPPFHPPPHHGPPRRLLVPSADKIKYEVDLREGGIASYVKHVNSLFDGTNGGKLLLGSDTFAGLEK